MKSKTLSKKSNSIKPFDFLNIFFEKKKIPADEVIMKSCDQWILNMTLSCSKNFTEIAHEMSKLKINNKMYFDFMYFGIPAGKRFIKYNASKSKQDKHIKYLMEYYHCSQQIAKDYAALIDESEMKNIVAYFENIGTK